LEKKGIRTALVASSEFAVMADVECESLGMSSLPIVVVPHPVGGLKEEAVREKADNALEEIIHVLTESKDKLSQEYREKVYTKQKETLGGRKSFG